LYFDVKVYYIISKLIGKSRNLLNKLEKRPDCYQWIRLLICTLNYMYIIILIH